MTFRKVKHFFFSLHLTQTQSAVQCASPFYGVCEKLGRIFFTGYFPDCHVFIWNSSVVEDGSFIILPDEHFKLLLLCSQEDCYEH